MGMPKKNNICSSGLSFLPQTVHPCINIIPMPVCHKNMVPFQFKFQFMLQL